ncbi:HD domain-containing protein [Xylocopilactobacillus apicola]|uniref:HD domain-containing protein n=1 Tax=Xylocopilactobacillus apicola TaxID=2932184 RepID=UPI00295356A6|nr:HD domain-containing protein [Xylocopilactobacillus apicola]
MEFLNLNREKVIRDPVHNYIHIRQKIIRNLIDTPEFQRLRRIKQLGTTSFTFPGAEHSRFTHSLGVFEITQTICDNFEQNYKSSSSQDGLWDDSNRLVALCAALLHDVGHGAFSHIFEDIFHTDHEKITGQIITDPTTQINQVLSEIDPKFPAEVASIIDHTHPNQQIVQMISSQIDADRMDYLLRDAYFTGTDYGLFDLTRILRVMLPYEDGIAFLSNGMHAVEDYIVSRFQMYQQVYFHPASRGMEAVLILLLRRCQYLYQHEQLTKDFSPELLIPFFEGTFTLQDYLNLDDQVISTYLIYWRSHSDPILCDLVNRFLDRNPLKSVQYHHSQNDLIQKLSELIEEAGYNLKYFTLKNFSKDLPYDAYHPNAKNPQTQIEIMLPNGNLKELSEQSPLVKAIAGKFQIDHRFFFPREFLRRDEFMAKTNLTNSKKIAIFEEFQRIIQLF